VERRWRSQYSMCKREAGAKLNRGGGEPMVWKEGGEASVCKREAGVKVNRRGGEAKVRKG
jgi:hypothetical protein